MDNLQIHVIDYRKNISDKHENRHKTPVLLRQTDIQIDR